MTRLELLRYRLQCRHWMKDENGLAILTKKDTDNPRFEKVLRQIFNTLDRAITAEPTMSEWQIIQILCQFELDSITIIHPDANPSADSADHAVEFCGAASNHKTESFHGSTYHEALYHAYQFYRINEPRHLPWSF